MRPTHAAILKWIEEHPRYTGMDLINVTPVDRMGDREMIYKRIRDLEKWGCVRIARHSRAHTLTVTGKPLPARKRKPDPLQYGPELLQVLQEQEDRIVACEIALGLRAPKQD